MFSWRALYKVLVAVLGLLVVPVVWKNDFLFLFLAFTLVFPNVLVIGLKQVKLGDEVMSAPQSMGYPFLGLCRRCPRRGEIQRL